MSRKVLKESRHPFQANGTIFFFFFFKSGIYMNMYMYMYMYMSTHIYGREEAVGLRRISGGSGFLGMPSVAKVVAGHLPCHSL